MSKVKMVSPIGEVKFPKVEVSIDPATQETKKKYSLALVFDPANEEVKTFINDVDEAVAASRYPKTKPVYKADKDKSEQTDASGDPIFEENGKLCMNFKSSYPINFFDSAGKKVDNTEMIGWGSRARISFELAEVDMYKCMTKYIKGIKIIELKELGASADSCGFGGEEEGFRAGSTNPDEPWAE